MSWDRVPQHGEKEEGRGGEDRREAPRELCRCTRPRAAVLEQHREDRPARWMRQLQEDGGGAHVLF